MKHVSAESWFVSIWIAGDYGRAKQICREWCMKVGACVTVTPTAYIYTGGAEDGVVVRFLNYPRFPKPPEEGPPRARELAELLREGLCQWSYTLEMPTRTDWFSYRPEDNQ